MAFLLRFIQLSVLLGLAVVLGRTESSRKVAEEQGCPYVTTALSNGYTGSYLLDGSTHRGFVRYRSSTHHPGRWTGSYILRDGEAAPWTVVHYSQDPNRPRIQFVCHHAEGCHGDRPLPGPALWASGENPGKSGGARVSCEDSFLLAHNRDHFSHATRVSNWDRALVIAPKQTNVTLDVTIRSFGVASTIYGCCREHHPGVVCPTPELHDFSRSFTVNDSMARFGLVPFQCKNYGVMVAYDSDERFDLTPRWHLESLAAPFLTGEYVSERIEFNKHQVWQLMVNEDQVGQDLTVVAWAGSRRRMCSIVFRIMWGERPIDRHYDQRFGDHARSFVIPVKNVRAGRTFVDVHLTALGAGERYCAYGIKVERAVPHRMQ